MRIFLAVYAVLALAFAVVVWMITGGTAAAVMALLGAALVGVVLWLVVRAFIPTKPRGTDVGGQS
ncbi:hypothetical protein HWD99_04415 [Microbacterium sp. C5A9]|uniref:hypothetical protein n=1 Tax=Microbacterium sp. C5A9 TaxID=2736663 RepID=UPI001F52638C|nr:hypothetical protein [Microbacterium sp. C5A9]MCI1017863.1 hypothetical protein [Microbacterium sp. C5A9]